MKPQHRIDELIREIEGLRCIQKDCRHTWGAPYYETRYRRESYGMQRDPACMGSDIYYIPEGYHDVPYTVYVRACTHCGFTQETTKTVTKVVKSETTPDFT